MKVLWKCAILFVFWGTWTERNVRLSRYNYISFILSLDRIFFLVYLRASPCVHLGVFM